MRRKLVTIMLATSLMACFVVGCGRKAASQKEGTVAETPTNEKIVATNSSQQASDLKSPLLPPTSNKTPKHDIDPIPKRDVESGRKALAGYWARGTDRAGEYHWMLWLADDGRTLKSLRRDRQKVEMFSQFKGRYQVEEFDLTWHEKSQWGEYTATISPRNSCKVVTFKQQYSEKVDIYLTCDHDASEPRLKLFEKNKKDGLFHLERPPEGGFSRVRATDAPPQEYTVKDRKDLEDELVKTLGGDDLFKQRRNSSAKKDVYRNEGRIVIVDTDKRQLDSRFSYDLPPERVARRRDELAAIVQIFQIERTLPVNSIYNTFTLVSLDWRVQVIDTATDTVVIDKTFLGRESAAGYRYVVVKGQEKVEYKETFNPHGEASYLLKKTFGWKEWSER